MFEDMTFENIMEAMMEEMPDDIDTSEGSLLYNACAKQAVQLEETYMFMSGIEKNMFADTADLEHLIRIGNDIGCFINEATYAEFEAQFNCVVPVGSRWNCDEYNYTVFNVIDENKHIYRIGCDTSGSGPNTLLSDLDPITFVEGFEWGKILKCRLQGKDQEDTELYRSRVLNSYNYRGFAGNREYYKGRIIEMPGVKACKLERVSKPDDQIKVMIAGDSFRTPDEDVVKEVQNTVDPVVTSGEGDGIAPIGHRVKVVGAEEETVNINTEITFESGYAYEDIKEYINRAVEEYFLEVREKWEKNDNLVVRILQVERAIVDVTGVEDVAGTTLNGAAKNYTVGKNKLSVKGELTCTSK